MNDFDKARNEGYKHWPEKLNDVVRVNKIKLMNNHIHAVINDPDYIGRGKEIDSSLDKILALMKTVFMNFYKRKNIDVKESPIYLYTIEQLKQWKDFDSVVLNLLLDRAEENKKLIETYKETKDLAVKSSVSKQLKERLVL